jgi:hypothetical protein
VSFADGVALLRRVLNTPGAVTRWPMYIRNVKQILRAAEPGFDERKHGNLVELLRAVQRDGLVRLDRDRQGVMRVFQGQQLRPVAAVELGLPVEDPALDYEMAMAARRAAYEAEEAARLAAAASGEPAGDTQPAAESTGDDGAADTSAAAPAETPAATDETAEPAPAKPRRRRKTADEAAPEKPAAVRKTRAPRATTTRKKKDKVTE